MCIFVHYDHSVNEGKLNCQNEVLAELNGPDLPGFGNTVTLLVAMGLPCSPGITVTPPWSRAGASFAPSA